MNPMIDVQETEPGIVQVTMQDTAGKTGCQKSLSESCTGYSKTSMPIRPIKPSF